MAEWLRREIRNLLGSPRAGSNPVRSESYCLLTSLDVGDKGPPIFKMASKNI